MIGKPNDMSLEEAITVARKAMALLLGELLDQPGPTNRELKDAYWVIARDHAILAEGE